MIYYKNNKYHMCEHKVKYKQHDEELIQYVMSEGYDWWVDFEEKWEHTEIIEFIEVKPTLEQISRLEEINQLNIKEGYSTELCDYVEHGIFPKGINHPLKSLQDTKKIKEFENIIDILLGGEGNE